MSQGKTATLLALIAIVIGSGSMGIRGQEATPEISRRAKSKVEPAYPELARKMNLAGTVKVRVVVSPSGMVTDAKIVGGHPVLGNAALDAVRKWRFEPATLESSGTVDFKFEAHQ